MLKDSRMTLSRRTPSSWRHSLVAFAALFASVACSDTTDPVEPPAGVPAVARAVVHYDCAAQTAISVSECGALTALYHSTEGDGWVNNGGWLEGGDPCGWYGVFCSGGEVVRIVLPFNQLTGPLPAELEGLAGLQVLDLFDNRLSGSIPPQLGRLTDLVTVVVTYNRLTGSVPPELGALENLQTLFAFDNQLSGPIPPELGDLRSLRQLSLGYNQLSGSIPPELGNLALLRQLNLRGNRLSGEIPAELGELGDLGLIPGGGFALDGNRLSGLVPIEVARIAGLAEQRALPDACYLRPDNPELYMPDVPSYRELDLDSDGTICGLGFSGDLETVRSDLLEKLTELSASGALNGGQANALGGRIQRAEALLAEGNAGAASNVLEAFVLHVEALARGGVLTPEEAAGLAVRARILIDLIA